MRAFPAIPDVPDDHKSKGPGFLRYEDVSQDGRVILHGLPHTAGVVVWVNLLASHPITRLSREQQIIPVLTRMVVAGEDGTVPVGRALSARGGFQLAHTRDDADEVDRLILNIWVDVDGPKGRTHAPPPAGKGEMVAVGRVFAEHVFTKPFAPAGQRKVLAFEDGALPAVPADAYQWENPARVSDVPNDATPLHDELHLGAPISFGLNHTDSNQHVNSLVYPRLFEHAALQYFAKLGESTVLLARYVETAYRKPCFAGDRVRIALRAYRNGDRLGAAGVFIADKDAGSPESARPYCFVHMVFAP